MYRFASLLLIASACTLGSRSIAAQPECSSQPFASSTAVTPLAIGDSSLSAPNFDERRFYWYGYYEYVDKSDFRHTGHAFGYVFAGSVVEARLLAEAQIEQIGRSHAGAFGVELSNYGVTEIHESP